MEATARHRSHGVEFRRQVALEFLAGETLRLAKRHDISRNLIRIWPDPHLGGEVRGRRSMTTRGPQLIQAYEARIAALERLVGKQAVELEFLKGARQLGPRPRRAPMSVIAGPAASPSRKDAD